MKHLIIIGARGFGREIYNLFLACEYQDMDCKGFLDDKSTALDKLPNYPPIIGPVESYIPQPDDVFICALGDVGYKRKYASIILEKGGTFISLVHPKASIGLNTKIGKGCIIEKNVVVSCDATIGDFVSILPGAILGHDTVVDDWSHIGSFTFMGGFSKIGKNVTLQPGAKILPHKKVLNDATVGTSSVVIRTVKEGDTVFGNPAIRMNLK